MCREQPDSNWDPVLLWGGDREDSYYQPLCSSLAQGNGTCVMRQCLCSPGKQAPFQSNTTYATLPHAPVLCSTARGMRLLRLLLLMSLPKLLVLGHSAGWGEVLLLRVQEGDVICSEAVHNLVWEKKSSALQVTRDEQHTFLTWKGFFCDILVYINNHLSNWTNEAWEGQ